MAVEAVSINGELYPADHAFVSAVDRGFMFGHGAFETFRVSGGKVFLLEEHFARLNRNLEALGIIWRYNSSVHHGWIRELCGNIPDEMDGRVRFCVTSGVDATPNVIIYLDFINKFEALEKNAKILTTLVRHKPEYFETTGFRIKSLEYSYLYLAKKELGGDDVAGILLNPDGYVAEALTSNIFWAKDGKLYTPPLSLGILAGTMRHWLMSNLVIKERLVKQDELLSADEVFLTAGASYLTAINQINGIKKPGLAGKNYKKIYEILGNSLRDQQTNL